ncbi:hypothetical protein DVH24_023904 [Malus domestica]|uniref:SWIRM domain-containing protein n=2 Tax=Malus TaxID=3749 RepID=A0A498JFA9_MALDO|nr:hypothetical protein DVH24_023904 [Malus domestica]
MFVDSIPKHCYSLLESTYKYLVSHGYINFGIAPAIKEKIPAEPSKPHVIVIGHGLAGLAAARQMMRFGFKVTALEGRNRAGGWVYTKKMEGGIREGVAADLGGSVLTGTLGNPLGIVARQLGYVLHKVRDKCLPYSFDGKPVDPDMDMKVEAAFNHLLDKASSLRQLMGCFSVDASLDLISKLSLAFWDQDGPYDMGGDHCFLPGGNGRLVHALAENLPILYERIVNTVRLLLATRFLRVIWPIWGIYEPQGITVPEPIQTICTRWGSDPFSLGAYSNVAVGASGDDYDILAESVGDGRLFFAGEATNRRYPATMHDAFVSGLREAANMAHYANAGALRIKINRNPSKNAHSCASLLADLFREPDLEFGSFYVIALIKAERGNRKPASTSLTLKSGTSKLKADNLKQKLVRRAKIMRNGNGKLG